MMNDKWTNLQTQEPLNSLLNLTELNVIKRPFLELEPFRNVFGDFEQNDGLTTKR